MKKLTSLLLVALMLCLVLVPALAEGGELPEYRITLLRTASDIKSSQETYAGQLIYDKFKVAFDYEIYTSDYVEKTNLMLASGDYGDIANVWWNNNLVNWIDAGAAIPLDDYLADMPNFTELHKDRIPLWRMSSEDGKLYKWEGDGSLVEGAAPLNDMLVRADVLEAMGWPQLRSADDYIEFIKQAKEMFPTTAEGIETVGMCVPLGESWGFALNQIFNEKGGYSGALGGSDCAQYDPVNETFVDMVSPYMKENVQFFNKLWTAGLLDRESFSSTSASITEKMNTGIPLVVFYPVWTRGTANANLRAAGKEDMNYVCMPIQSNEQANADMSRNLGVWHSNSLQSFVITDKCKDPERLLQVLDWCSSEEGLNAIGWGQEGVHYTVVDGKKVPTPEMIEIYKERGDAWKKIGIGFSGNPFSGFIMGANEYNGQPISIEYDEAMIKLGYTDLENKVLQAYGLETFMDFWHGKPIKGELRDYFYVTAAATLPVESDLVKTQEKIAQNRNESIADIIKAQGDAAFEAAWSAFIEKHNSFNPQEIIDAKNAQLAELKAQYNAN